MKKTKKLVIALNGIATSGKDELVTQILDKFNNNGLIITNISSVDVTKDLALKYFGWDGVKDEKGRNLLSDLKDASTKYNNKPFNDYVNKILDMDSDVFFVHIREVDEIEELKKWCSSIPEIEFTSLKVERSSVTNKFVNNTGDIGATLPYNYDTTLVNNKSLAMWGNKSCEWFGVTIEPYFGGNILTHAQ